MREKLVYISLTLMVAGTILFTINLVDYIKVSSLINSNSAIRIDAEVYDYEQEFRGAPGDSVKSCDTYYEFYVGGSRYTGENNDCHYGNVIGDEITIYYNSENPYENYDLEMKSVFHLWPILLVITGVGVFIYTKRAIFL